MWMGIGVRIPMTIPIITGVRGETEIRILEKEVIKGFGEGCRLKKSTGRSKEKKMSFKVIRIIDGDTFEISPNWKWNDQEGSAVRVNGYDTPELGQVGYQAAKDKLARLILGKDVELKNAIKITYGRLLCDIYCQGKNLADYFSMYK